MALYKLFICLLCFALPAYCGAQLNYDFTEGKFFIKGRVIDVQSQQAVPSANVRILNNNKMYTGDAEGGFAMYVSKKDTLKFSCVGYISKLIMVADLDTTKYYVLEIQLMRDFVKLKEAVIYPFRDMEEFKKAFINKDVSGITMHGIEKPKYGTATPSPKLYNPVSFLYEKLKRRRRAADPEFKP